MTESDVLLLQNPDGPVLTACSCGDAVLLGEYTSALPGPDGWRPLCTRCARQAAPEVAAVVEGLNALAVAAPGLSPAQSTRLLCALVEQVARLAGPTVAFLNVNPLIIERINKP